MHSAALRYRSRRVTQQPGEGDQLTRRVRLGTINSNVVANTMRLACLIFGCVNMATCLFFLLVWRRPPLWWSPGYRVETGFKPPRQNPAMAFLDAVFLSQLP